MAVITFLEYQRRRKRWFNYDFAPGDRPSAEVIQVFPPRIIPIPRPNQMIIPQDDLEQADIISDGLARMRASLSLGGRLLHTYNELALRLGKEEANRQVWAIVDEYLKEKAA